MGKDDFPFSWFFSKAIDSLMASGATDFKASMAIFSSSSVIGWYRVLKKKYSPGGWYRGFLCCMRVVICKPMYNSTLNGPKMSNVDWLVPAASVLTVSISRKQKLVTLTYKGEEIDMGRLRTQVLTSAKVAKMVTQIEKSISDRPESSRTRPNVDGIVFYLFPLWQGSFSSLQGSFAPIPVWSGLYHQR